MDHVIARLAPHRRLLGILASLSVLALGLVVGYGVIVSRAPRALARQPQMTATALATPEAPPATTDASAVPATATPGTPGAPVPYGREGRWIK